MGIYPKYKGFVNVVTSIKFLNSNPVKPQGIASQEGCATCPAFRLSDRGFRVLGFGV